MDKFRIDGHKLFYHVARVNDWLRGENIYPVYVEISPIGSCNHRCIYCALDFMKYRPRFLDKDLLKNRLSEMAGLGIKSVMYAGEGEPLLHKDIADIVDHTKKSGIDVAITTNGVLFDTRLSESILADLTWIKVSINAATKETYSKVHRTNPDDFVKVFKNMSHAARIRRNRHYKSTLGMQIMLLPENYREISLLAKKAKDIGMDYLVVKPYSQHPFSKTTRYKNIKYSNYLKLADKLNKFNSKKFNLIFRIHTMKKWDESRRGYNHCLALPFWGYIDAGGGVWNCSAYLSDRRFRLGDIHKNKFQDIWGSAKRSRLTRWASKRLNTDECRTNCRMDEINSYLWELKHPNEHVNFI